MNRAAITPAMMDALAKINRWCDWCGSHDFAVTPVGNRVTGQLAKLGWVEVRVTKVHGTTNEKTKIYRCRMTPAGRAALQIAGVK